MPVLMVIRSTSWTVCVSVYLKVSNVRRFHQEVYEIMTTSKVNPLPAITVSIQGGSGISKYSDASPDVLHYIADELKTITLDESNHSAFAWRTLKWVCTIDSDACNAVEMEVYDKSKLKMRFQQRAEGDEKLFDLMKAEWEMIYSTFKLGVPDNSARVSHDSLVSKVTEKVKGELS